MLGLELGKLHHSHRTNCTHWVQVISPTIRRALPSSKDDNEKTCSLAENLGTCVRNRKIGFRLGDSENMF